MCQMIVRSFGYGIMMVEAVGKDIQTVEDMRKLVEDMFKEVREWIHADGDPNRALLLINVGHAPTKLELSQLNSEDWEWMRDVVDAKGSQAFSDRLTMLEECRTSSIMPPSIRSPMS